MLQKHYYIFNVVLLFTQYLSCAPTIFTTIHILRSFYKCIFKNGNATKHCHIFSNKLYASFLICCKIELRASELSCIHRLFRVWGTLRHRRSVILHITHNFGCVTTNFTIVHLQWCFYKRLFKIEYVTETFPYFNVKLSHLNVVLLLM